MSVMIRRFIKTDQESALKLHVEGLNQFNASIGDPELDQDIQNIEEHYLQTGGDFIILELNNLVIGMGGFRKKNEDTAEIKRIRVDVNYQQNGYGRMILEKLEFLAKEEGYKRLILDTTINQIPAQKLFFNSGYVETGRRSYRGLDIIFYEKLLKV